jgi:hypothetical protein
MQAGEIRGSRPSADTTTASIKTEVKYEEAKTEVKEEVLETNVAGASSWLGNDSTIQSAAIGIQDPVRISPDVAGQDSGVQHSAVLGPIREEDTTESGFDDAAGCVDVPKDDAAIKRAVCKHGARASTE